MSSELTLSSAELFPPFVDGAEEIGAHLGSLNQRLGAAVERFRQSRTLEQRNGLSGVAIFEEEIDAFLAAPVAPANAAPAGQRQRLRMRTEASRERGIALPIETLRRRFDLSEHELEAMAHALAIELHPGYGRVFGYLNNDLTRQRPSVALVVEVLGASWTERLRVRKALGAGSALFRFGLLTMRAEADHSTAELSLDAQVLDLLLGAGVPDAEADPSALDELLISPAERAAAGRIAAALSREVAGSMVVLISGAPGSGRRTCAAAICRAVGRRLRSTGKAARPAALGAQLPQMLRDARLGGEVPGIYAPGAAAAATLAGTMAGMGDEAGVLPPLLGAIAAAGSPVAFVFVEAEAPPRLGGLGGAEILRLHLEPPRTASRVTAWKRALAARGLIPPGEEELARISAVYPFSVGRIHAAAEAALPPGRDGGADGGADARADGGAGRILDGASLALACREQADHRLERLAERLPTRQGWGDIVLPKDELDRLQEIAGAVRNRDRVLEQWGFGEKVAASPGVNAIFFGPSGTGKTMAASILAGELGMAIFRADLSKVVSKYIGETERNLDALFDEARRSFSLLFFDEAEALFGKRSEVKDAHDRYANIEVAYLLQRMERFEGVAILATNLRKHLDSAFLRRLQFAVEFPLPTAADRLRIWRSVWPPAAALGADLDLDFMAAQLELSGGHIRNVAMTAAYLAAQGPAPIGMRHLLAATRREMQKLGRACVPEQFGRYAPLLQDAAG